MNVQKRKPSRPSQLPGRSPAPRSSGPARNPRIRPARPGPKRGGATWPELPLWWGHGGVRGHHGNVTKNMFGFGWLLMVLGWFSMGEWVDGLMVLDCLDCLAAGGGLCSWRAHLSSL